MGVPRVAQHHCISTVHVILLLLFFLIADFCHEQQKICFFPPSNPHKGSALERQQPFLYLLYALGPIWCNFQINKSTCSHLLCLFKLFSLSPSLPSLPGWCSTQPSTCTLHSRNTDILCAFCCWTCTPTPAASGEN